MTKSKSLDNWVVHNLQKREDIKRGLVIQTKTQEGEGEEDCTLKERNWSLGEEEKREREILLSEKLI